MTESYFIRGHKALESGKARRYSSFFAGIKHLKPGKARSAFRLFLLGAKEGDHSCQQVLGYLYDKGIGVKANVSKAIYWYDQACMHGESSAAAWNLVLLYRQTGQEKLAAKYLRRAAKLGDEEAQQEIGESG